MKTVTREGKDSFARGYRRFDLGLNQTSSKGLAALTC